ncbi:MAG: DNA alkylation repair protein [Bacteroidales bacterium]
MRNKPEEIAKDVLKNIETLSENPANVKDYARFYKDKEEFITLTTPVIRQLAKDYFQNIKKADKQYILETCDKLLALRDKNCTHIAFDWAFRIKKHYQKDDLERFEKWVEKYLDDWSSCDDLSTHALGYQGWKFPENIKRLYEWTSSGNLWVRRAAAVSLIYSVRRNTNIGAAFKMADNLLTDPEDLVQKGYGWLLKETTKHQEKAVFDYIMQNKQKMPRTALRYAIERMPRELKAKAMR